VTAQGKLGQPFQPPTLPFLLEVGCEEIPARFLRDAERDLGERLLAGLREDRLLPHAWAVCEPPLPGNPGDHEPNPEPPILTYSTPRRLVVYVPKLLAQQPDKVEEVQGPPLKVAVDAEGKYTRAAESFAQKNSARLEDLVRTTTPKGEYLALRKTTQGRSAQAILPEILPQAILGMSFPKSMYWTEKSAHRFVRPIRWVLAVLGEGKQAQTVDFEILGVKSGNFTFGHRAKGYRPQRVTGFKDYMRKLEQALVEIDPAGRRQQIAAGLLGIEMGSLRLVPDEWLMDWAVNSTEWPRAMLGNFDERFLDLPREILITVMRDHQKYFAVEDGQGSLRPHFVAVLNMDSDAKGLIRQGHERVLAARFSDAEFFWKTDLKTTLFERIPLLEGITYQAGLGTYAQKVSRMRTIASGLCARFEAYPVAFVPWHCAGLPSGPSEQRVKVRFAAEHTRNILRAVELCKCDLTTQMVQEFPELQGIVGGLYVAAQPSAESPEVAEAIYDHYRPAGAEDTCPRSIVGAVVSLADKLDSVVAGFAVGHRPTGSSDPFAIRRQGNGIIKVLLEYSLPIDLDFEIRRASDALHEILNFDLQQGTDAVEEFVRERLAYYLENVIGLRYDTVRAAMRHRTHRFVLEPLRVMTAARAVEKIRPRPDFMALSRSAKRVGNILNKSANLLDYEGGSVDPQRFEAGAERNLYHAYERVRDQAAQKRQQGDIYGALEAIASLAPTVDAFFDNVLVMAKDREVRRNRLQLLFTLDRLFTEDADSSEIEGPNVDASTLGGNKKDA